MRVAAAYSQGELAGASRGVEEQYTAEELLEAATGRASAAEATSKGWRDAHASLQGEVAGLQRANRDLRREVEELTARHQHLSEYSAQEVDCLSSIVASQEAALSAQEVQLDAQADSRTAKAEAGAIALEALTPDLNPDPNPDPNPGGAHPRPPSCRPPLPRE
jgi:predicted  nucleic acid-binding Zn-ribbon protein